MWNVSPDKLWGILAKRKCSKPLKSWLVSGFHVRRSMETNDNSRDSHHRRALTHMEAKAHMEAKSHADSWAHTDYAS